MSNEIELLIIVVIECINIVNVDEIINIVYIINHVISFYFFVINVFLICCKIVIKKLSKTFSKKLSSIKNELSKIFINKKEKTINVKMSIEIKTSIKTMSINAIE